MIGISEDDLPGLQEPTQREGHQRIELFFSCRSLKNRDKSSLSDPQIKVYMENSKKQKYLKHTTEVIKDNLNPDFVKTVSLDYIFEVKQSIYFEIIDIDSKDGQYDPLGVAETTIGDIMGAQHQLAILNITLGGQKAGKLIVRGEIVDGSPAWTTLKFQAKGLNNVAGLFSKMNPMMEMSRQSGEESQVIVYRSDAKPKTKNPQWDRFEISMQTLCNNDEHRPIRVEIFHKKKLSKKPIGLSVITMHDIQSGTRSFPINDFKKTTKKVGTLEIDEYSVQSKPTFLEYLRGGVQLNVIVAIDFTQSNGNPKARSSLHAINDGGSVLNDYQKAIMGVCEILLCYDYDKKVALFGFGGKPFGEGEVNHCFSLTSSEEDPYADGLDGIMEVYKNALVNVTQSGPTFFKHILRKSMDFSEQEKKDGSNVYTILLVLTDGAIHDMQPTIDGLVDCGQLPLSVIIVGVGNEDFAKMEKLDADDEPLHNNKGIKAERDLVQFVPFNKFKGDREQLAQEVLAEVPAQFLQYMKSQYLMPKKKEAFDFSKLVRSSTNLSHSQSINESQISSLLSRKKESENQNENMKVKQIPNLKDGEERKIEDLPYFKGHHPDAYVDNTPIASQTNFSLNRLDSGGSGFDRSPKKQMTNISNKLELIGGDQLEEVDSDEQEDEDDKDDNLFAPENFK